VVGSLASGQLLQASWLQLGPLEEPGRFWRGVLRALLAGPLGMTAAMGVAFCVTVYLPGDPRTRIVLGGLLLPIL
jgi:hypothetical protein